MAYIDLTSLPAAKLWLLQQDSSVITSDPFIKSLISSSSAFIYTYLSRDTFLRTEHLFTFNGTGKQRVMLTNWPVLSVSSVLIDGQSITPSPAFMQGKAYQTGWFLEPSPSDDQPPTRPQEVILTGYCFTPGTQNIQISYTSGYVVLNEHQTITIYQPNPTVTAIYQCQANSPFGNWVKDEGVTFSNGTALVYVVSSPAAGQYSYGPSPGMYLFNAADVNKTILITYSYIPYDLEQCCIEMVSERFAYSNRIGMSSKALAGQGATTYKLGAMNDYTMAILNQYRNVVPIY